MDSTQLDQAVTLRTTRRLSPAQRGFVASQLRHPRTTSLNMTLLVSFNARLDADRFSAAFDAVVRASDVLRTRIEPGDATQATVSPDPTAPTHHVSLESAHVDSWADELARRPLDLAASCYHSTLADHGDAASWCITVHHLAIDASAFRLLVERTVAAYLGTEPATSRFYPWVDSLEHDDVKRTKRSEYWTARLPAARPGRVYQATDRTTAAATRLPVDLESPDHQDLATALEGPYRLLSPELSWAGLLVTSTAVYLHRLTGAAGFAIGVPVHHRNSDETDQLIGPTLAVYPVDVDVRLDDTFQSLHRRVSRSLMKTLGNADPGVTAPGDYDAVVNVIPNVAPASNPELPTTARWIHPGAIDPEHVLRIQATRYGQADASASPVDIDLELQDQTATEAQRVRAPEHYRSVLRSMIKDPTASVYAASLCVADELASIMGAETSPDTLEHPGLLGPRLQLTLQGNQQVVASTATQSYTGDQLWAWITNLTNDLRSDRAGQGRVGIELAPSIESVVAIFACLLAHRSFVPLDPAQPAARTAALASRASLTRVLRSVEEIRAFAIAPVTEPLNQLVDVRPDDEAYLLFTSGSTGEPKGVPISHGGLARYIDFALASYFPDSLRPVAPLFSSLTFDLTITTLFSPILAGGQLALIDASGPAALAEIADNPHVNWLKATPSHLEILTSLLSPEAALAVVVVGGEAFRSDLAERLLGLNPAMAIFNEYGPTEAVVGCMIHQVDPASNTADVAVPIGVPAPGVELRVADPGGQRLPLGCAGELLISHIGMTTGYLSGNDEVFVELDGKRFYRSGDLVTRNTDLGLTYLGRIDEQIKVGGVRLDPAEVENALLQHPAIAGAAVRQWQPSTSQADQHCVRCGLPSNVPGVDYDDQGVCGTCLDYDRIAPAAAAYFRDEDDLAAVLGALKPDGGDYDCVHLLSGGKDSTYALYRLVELGFRPFALTLDNGFISEEALENCRRVAQHLDLDYEFVSTPQMNEIFRDSLRTYSDVCHGCYKTIYTLATNKAVELGVNAIVTGLSRGQLFETRLIPAQFEHDRFDPDAIDRAVVEARKRYHRAPDRTNQLLDTSVFETDDVFDSLHYVDIYRYLDVELADVLTYLETNTPWQRPSDTGRSSNCLINIAGIHAHQVEQGYHNYAEPYAWDVRLGHKRRDESMAELDDPVDMAEIESLLAAVGYNPAPKQVLTAWLQVDAYAARPPTPAELRSFLAERLASHAIPSAFVMVDQLAMTANGKLDQHALPAPEREHRAAIGTYLAPETELEATIIAKYEAVLGLNPISSTDDFFALGGDSLAAVTMIVELGNQLDRVIREELAFTHSSARELALAIEQQSTTIASNTSSALALLGDPVGRRAAEESPELSAGELTLLYHQASRPDGVMYNIARTFTVGGPVDAARFQAALDQAVARHEPFTWTYGSPRVPVAPENRVRFELAEHITDQEMLAEQLRAWQRTPFDLEAGPLVRCRLAETSDSTTLVAIAIHHVGGDHQSLDLLWADIDRAYQGVEAGPLAIGYGDFCAWQRDGDAAHTSHWDSCGPFPTRPDFGVAPGQCLDGYVECAAQLSPTHLRTAIKRTPVANAVAAAAAAVAPYFDGDRVEVNLIASTRDHDAACNLVGYLLNPLPLTFERDTMQVLGDFAQHVSATIAPALSHRSYPFAQIAADARERHAQPPSGSVLVSYSDDPAVELAGLPVQQRMLFNGEAVADLTFFVEPREHHVHLGIEYSGARLNAETAALILERFDHALYAAVTDASTAEADLTTPEPSFLAGPELESNGLLLDQIMAHVTSQPTAMAVEVGAESITWSQLGARASQLAAQLTMQGIGSGDRVAVRLPRSVHLPVAILGTLLTGAAYVPLDPSYPQARIDHAVSASAVSFEITAEQMAGMVWDDATPLSPVTVPADTEAYVIFTSGSTGSANGVPITHQQLANSTNARDGFYSTSPERFLVPSSVAFDSSIVGIFWTLSRGGRLVLPADDVVHDIDGLATLFTSANLSHVLSVPTLYDAVLDRALSTSTWPAHVIVAGEACPPRLVERHFAAVPSAALTNEYGPTETTVWATAHHCSPDDSNFIPIGTPIAGTWVAVVDSTGRVRPHGCVGELVIGGPNVSAGYLHGESTKFGAADQLTGVTATGPIFRTGDQAVIVDDTVRFVGRLDDQLNIGGARVEPTEIEAALAAVPGIAQVVVVAADVRPLEQLLSEASADETRAAMLQAAQATDPESALRVALGNVGRPDLRLVAHVAATPGPSGAEVSDAMLRDGVSDLPATSRPNIFCHHDQLPQLPNGKIDRAAVAQLAVALPSSSATGSGPGSEHDLVSAVQRLFTAVLGVGDVQPTSSFFDLGGDSLRALELLRHIEADLGVRLPTSAIHNSPTPHALALILSTSAITATTSDDDNTIVIHIQPDGEQPPIFALHNLGVDASMWRPMSGYLGTDHPMFGIADPFALLDPFGDSYQLEHRPEIHETAARYVEHINTIAPTGPVILLGFCIGGVLGYEVAQQLKAAGREIADFVIVLDWHAPHLEYEENWITMTKLSYRRSEKSLVTHVKGLLTRRAFLKSLRRRAEGYAVRAMAKFKLPMNERLRARQYVEEGIHRIHSYVYEPYDGRITVVRSTQDPRIPTDLGDAGWGDLVSDLRVHYAPGIGERMLYEPNIEAVTEIVRRAITQGPPTAS